MAGRNFLISGVMKGYVLSMMLVIFFIQSVIMDAQTKMAVSEMGSNGKRYTAGC